MLATAVEDYLALRKGQGMSANTIRNDRSALGKFLTHVGPIDIAQVDDAIVDGYLNEQAEYLMPSSLNTQLNYLRPFFDYVVRRGHLPANPTAHRKQWKVIAAEKTRVPVGRFAELLDAADHPRDRAALALGLYLFLRRSEIATLNVGDLDLENCEINVTVHKSGKRDIMPVSLELGLELNLWLGYYADALGRDLRGDDPLVPACHAPTFEGPGVVSLRPAPIKEGARMTTMGDVMKRAMLKMGMGDRPGEAMHVLRRSGARARFDVLVNRSYDGAIREVQAMLHHESVATTEVYLGLTLDVQKRNTAIKGKSMFDAPTSSPVRDNVIPLRRA